MITAKQVNQSKNAKDQGLRMASKTIRKLTETFFGQSEGCTLPDRLCVNLDMLHVMVEAYVPDPTTAEDYVNSQDNIITHWISGDMCLEYQHTGTPVFKNKWHIFQDGERVGTLLTHSRDQRRIKDGLCKLEIENHLFYSRNWYDTYKEILFYLRGEMRNISQLHIAVDGCNHLYSFLNAYDKQSRHNAVVFKKGKANFDAKQKRNFMANNFKIGSGHKYFTVYNKTSEIEKVSNKEYIRDIWKMNNFNLSADTWRCEMRLDSQGVKDLKAIEIEKVDQDGEFVFDKKQNEWEQGVEIERLLFTDYLMSIFKTACSNFFEFVINTGLANISREQSIDLFGYEFQQVQLLQKVKRPLSRGFYKAKMAVHNAVSNILLRHIEDVKSVRAALLHVRDNVTMYNLERFYQKKLPEWIERYQPTRTQQDYNKYKLKLLNIVR